MKGYVKCFGSLKTGGILYLYENQPTLAPPFLGEKKNWGAPPMPPAGSVLHLFYLLRPLFD